MEKEFKFTYRCLLVLELGSGISGIFCISSLSDMSKQNSTSVIRLSLDNALLYSLCIHKTTIQLNISTTYDRAK